MIMTRDWRVIILLERRQEKNIKKAQQRPQAVLISLVVLRCQFRSFGRKSPFPFGYGPLYRNDDDMTDDYYSRIKYA